MTEHALHKTVAEERATFEAVLPFPPSVNGLYTNVPGKGRVRTAAYRRWATAAGWEINRVRRGEPIIGPVSIGIDVRRKDRRKRDLDNLAKGVIDLLVKMGVIADDRQVDELHMRWVDHANFEGALVWVVRSA